jgi:hypothetical protein
VVPRQGNEGWAWGILLKEQPSEIIGVSSPVDCTQLPPLHNIITHQVSVTEDDAVIRAVGVRIGAILTTLKLVWRWIALIIEILLSINRLTSGVLSLATAAAKNFGKWITLILPCQ